MKNAHVTLKLFCITLGLCVFANQTSAQSVRFIDESGNIHWVDSVGQVPEKYKYQLATPTPIGGGDPNNPAYKAYMKELNRLEREKQKEQKRKEREIQKEQKRKENELKKKLKEEEKKRAKEEKRQKKLEAALKTKRGKTVIVAAPKQNPSTRAYTMPKGSPSPKAAEKKEEESN